MIGQWTLDDVVKVTGGQLHGQPRAFSRVVTDSRQDCRDALFVALSGPRFDGHDHVQHALNAGAVAALTAREVAEADQVVVLDTLQALQELAQANRARFAGKVVALTGSAGKTTTKEMCRVMLGEQAWATPGNLNNHIGVPLTLLSLEAQHRYAVTEIGANHLGEIADLVKRVMPDVAIVTSVGLAHVGEFGSPEAIVRAKSEIFSELGQEGIAILPAGKPYSQALLAAVPRHARILTFGWVADADIRARHESGETRVYFQGRDIGALRLALPGQHSVENALAALAACHAVDMPVDTAIRRLDGFRGQAGRLSELSVGAITFIDDSYNASPEAVLAALDVLASRSEPVKIAMLGAMAELGAHACEQHERVLEAAGAHDLEVVRVGQWPESLRGERWFETPGQAARWLRSRVTPGERIAVLLKGSRREGMEQVISIIEQNGSQV